MKPISPGKYLALFAALACALTGLVAFTNWVIDPLQYYRRASYPPEFSDQTRYQNPGLARHFPYDTAIIGTSVSRGFDLAQMHTLLGWDAMNLSMQGASAREQSLMLEVALRSGRVHRVLWDVNCEFLRGRRDWVSDFEGAFPAYLYSTDPLDQLTGYLLNVDTSKATLRVLLRNCGIKLYRPRTVADLSGLEASAKAVGREAILRKWRHQGPMVFATESAQFTPELLDAQLRRQFFAPDARASWRRV